MHRWQSVLAGMLSLVILFPLGAGSLRAAPLPAARPGSTDDSRALREELRALRAALAEFRQTLEQQQKVGQAQAEQVKQLEQERARLLAERKQLQAEKLALQAERDLLRARTAQLEARLRAVSVERARQEGSPRTPPANRPREQVEGKILALEERTGAVVLSLGADAGLAPGETLEVFRVGDRPAEARYLGTLRIVKVAPREAVGMPAGRWLAPVRIGDRVTRRLTEGK